MLILKHLSLPLKLTVRRWQCFVCNREHLMGLQFSFDAWNLGNFWCEYLTLKWCGLIYFFRIFQKILQLQRSKMSSLFLRSKYLFWRKITSLVGCWMSVITVSIRMDRSEVCEDVVYEKCASASLLNAIGQSVLKVVCSWAVQKRWWIAF